MGFCEMLFTNVELQTASNADDVFSLYISSVISPCHLSALPLSPSRLLSS